MSGIQVWKKCAVGAGVLLIMGTMSTNALAISSYRSRLPSTSATGAGCITCHISPGGSGPRNDFGTAFGANGRVWDAVLAGLDSDGDGYSNGVELGDPTGTVTGNAMNPSLFVSAPGDVSSTPCGNGMLDATLSGTEACDGAMFNGATCQTEGFGGGALLCDASCMIDTTQCNPCGNNTLDAGEVCDGGDLDGATCVSEGFVTGALACNTSCTFDTTQCTNCGDNIRDPGEQCDGTDLNSATCVSRGFDSGTLACDVGCQFDATQCVPAINEVCGDMIRQGNEQCDDADLDGETCETRGFGGGTLGCDAGCVFDEAQCDPCGNGVLDAGEACDGDLFDNATCQSEGFDSGELDCSALCELDTSSCVMAPMDMGMADMGGDMDTADMASDMAMADMDLSDMDTMDMNAADMMQEDMGSDMASSDDMNVAVDMMVAMNDMSPGAQDMEVPPANFRPPARPVDEGEIAGSRGCCAVVEPTTDTSEGWLLLGLGCVVMGWRRRRRRD